MVSFAPIDTTSCLSDNILEGSFDHGSPSLGSNFPQKLGLSRVNRKYRESRSQTGHHHHLKPNQLLSTKCYQMPTKICQVSDKGHPHILRSRTWPFLYDHPSLLDYECSKQLEKLSGDPLADNLLKSKATDPFLLDSAVIYRRDEDIFNGITVEAKKPQHSYIDVSKVTRQELLSFELEQSAMNCGLSMDFGTLLTNPYLLSIPSQQQQQPMTPRLLDNKSKTYKIMISKSTNTYEGDGDVQTRPQQIFCLRIKRKSTAKENIDSAKPPKKRRRTEENVLKEVENGTYRSKENVQVNTTERNKRASLTSGVDRLKSVIDNVRNSRKVSKKKVIDEAIVEIENYENEERKLLAEKKRLKYDQELLMIKLADFMTT